jgi:NADPH-dependent curcumin reductase
MNNLQVKLAQRPKGMAQKEDFLIENSEIPNISEGQVLIKNHYISIDPAIRGWMNEGTTYIPGIAIGSVIRAFAVGEIVESKNAQLPVGQMIGGLLGATTYAISDGKGLDILDISVGDLPLHLGVLGMPGMTSYFGLLDKGKPVAGETVFISGAAGVIGTTVGQIAKIKGCKVVGTAGGKEKCDYLLSIGFDVAIDYKIEDVNLALKEHCPEGISIFFDNVGGEILDIALMNLARGARVVICGAISQYNNHTNIQGPKNYMKIVTARGEIKGIIVFDYLDQYSVAVKDITNWLKSNELQPKSHIIEGLENFPDALKMLFEGKNFGKLLIKI